ncbi:helix-turn-helix domain-containing protein [Dactylosporangium sp. CS-033363]|uniref:helix-turn-helix domain-containing protein n=1 Tax=Dactylosporangium sp. CS-033363 TaxID=3239935 RepID=UPI003D8B9D23
MVVGAGETNGGSTVLRRQLGRHLARERDRAGMSLEQAGKLLEMSRAKLSRVERGEVQLRTFEVTAMCQIYGTSPELTAELAGLAPLTRARGWWHPNRKAVPPLFDLYLGMEAAAATLRNFEAGFVPGLLQTRAYAEAVIRSGAPLLDDEQVGQRVDLRIERQRILGRANPPRLDVIIDEAVLRRPVPDPAGMAEQLDQLLEGARPAAAVVRVLPFTAAPTMASMTTAFVIVGFPDAGPREPEPATVYSEQLTGALYLEEEKEVAAHEEAWKELEAKAMNPQDSSALIEKIAQEYRHAT